MKLSSPDQKTLKKKICSKSYWWKEVTFEPTLEQTDDNMVPFSNDTHTLLPLNTYIMAPQMMNNKS